MTILDVMLDLNFGVFLQMNALPFLMAQITFVPYFQFGLIHLGNMTSYVLFFQGYYIVSKVSLNELYNSNKLVLKFYKLLQFSI
jgi:hypothetical protein